MSLCRNVLGCSISLRELRTSRICDSCCAAIHTAVPFPKRAEDLTDMRASKETDSGLSYVGYKNALAAAP
jgi:hypothetical protein